MGCCILIPHPNYSMHLRRHRILLQGHREWKNCCTCWQPSKLPAELKKERKGSQMLNSKLTIRLTLRVSTLYWACLQVCGLRSASRDYQTAKLYQLLAVVVFVPWNAW